MLKQIEQLARPAILKLRAYQSARSLATEARVFLDANEAPNAGAEAGRNRYPLPQPRSLVETFAKLYGVEANQIVIGRGSDEAIDLLTRTFCEAGTDEILITPPTYGMYEVAAHTQGAAVAEVPLERNGVEWKINVAGIARQVAASDFKTKIVYICSPNNPTGNAFPLAEIRAVCEAVAGRALVVVDEAYGEFAPEFSAVPLLHEFPNVVILRTLSKAWGLAGLRCGVALAHPDLISLLHKVRAPYPLPQPVIEEASRALSSDGQKAMRDRVNQLVNERERLARNFRELASVEAIFPSQGNFLLVQFRDAAAAMNLCKQAGILLRNRDSELGLKGCVRITVGSKEENDLLLNTLRSL